MLHMEDTRSEGRKSQREKYNLNIEHPITSQINNVSIEINLAHLLRETHRVQ